MAAAMAALTSAIWSAGLIWSSSVPASAAAAVSGRHVVGVAGFEALLPVAVAGGDLAFEHVAPVRAGAHPARQ